MAVRPIGMFDRGFGGLTVARAFMDLCPHESLVYFGDTARYPYGPRPLDEVRTFAHEIAERLVRDHDVKFLVVACNTASAAALDELAADLPVPVIGVIEPGQLEADACFWQPPNVLCCYRKLQPKCHMVAACEFRSVHQPTN